MRLSCRDAAQLGGASRHRSASP